MWVDVNTYVYISVCLIRVGASLGWCMLIGISVCLCGISVPGCSQALLPPDTPSAVCLQGNRGRLGVVVAAYMHYSNISAR